MRSETPVTNNLVPMDGSYGIDSIYDLYENSIDRFVTNSKVPFVVVYTGPPMSSKSRVKAEGIKMYSEHPKIKHWQTISGRNIEIRESLFETGLPPKQDRTYAEAEYHQASYDLGTNIVRNLEWLQTHPGGLFIETPAVMGLKIVKEGITYDVPVGYERGNTPLFYLARGLNGPGSLQYLQDLKYDLSAVNLSSSVEVQREALMMKLYQSDTTEDGKVIMGILKENRVYGDPDVEKSGGASVEQALLENNRFRETVTFLGGLDVIKLPPRGEVDYWLKASTEYARYFFETYLRMDCKRIYHGMNGPLYHKSMSRLSG